jgi:hypothetical protein
MINLSDYLHIGRIDNLEAINLKFLASEDEPFGYPL